jgi:hypothetical protein
VFAVRLFLAGAFWYAWQTILIVLLIVVGGPWWVWRVVLYIRKKANAPMDLELLLYGLLAAIDVLSATLVMVLLVVSEGFRGRLEVRVCRNILLNLRCQPLADVTCDALHSQACHGTKRTVSCCCKDSWHLLMCCQLLSWRLSWW